ncbi:MAG: hypothetical protein ACJ751_01760 [Niastella sp.]|uniref:hypothetical protein n=1 Tax=Niastella sp. TaxID=1869183 RepID=UPI00389A483B
MKYAFLKQLLLAIAIWFWAVILNTILGTIYLVAINFDTAGNLLECGIFYGAIFSFPIMITILIIIITYTANNKKGARLFNTVFITSIVLTVIASVLFWKLVYVRGIVMGLVLMCITIVSGIISLMTFYKRLVQLGGDFRTA